MKLFAFALLLSIILAGSRASAISFVINNVGDGFAQGKTERVALQYAADIWGGLLAESYPGETVVVNAAFDANQTALAATSVKKIFDPSLIDADGAENYFFFPMALANHLSTNGEDLNDATAEINITFNPDPTAVNGTINVPWYFGTDGATPSDNFDFVTNALHELMHGLGMISGMGDGGTLFPTGDPGKSGSFYTGYVYDQFVKDQTTDSFLIGMSMQNRDEALDKGDLVFTGNSATLANGRINPKLFVPDPFRSGSSVVHLDPLILVPES
jgi:hypothetical protein